MRTAAALLSLAAVCFVVGAALFSPRVAVLVAGACLLAAGALMIEVNE